MNHAFRNVVVPLALFLHGTAVAQPDDAFDHGAFSTLLAAHVAADGWVDYASLKKDAPALDAYIHTLATARLDRLSRNEHLALLINAYNAFTLRLILDHYPIKSIRDIPSAKRWSAKRWTVGGQMLSLDDIEHKLIRPVFNEPRIHFAVNCASVGCPPLRQEAYTGAALETQLDAQTRRINNHPQWVQVDEKAKRLRLTKLYDWYGSDFKTDGRKLTQFVASYSKAVAKLLARTPNPSIEWLKYDWSLNDRAKTP